MRSILIVALLSLSSLKATADTEQLTVQPEKPLLYPIKLLASEYLYGEFTAQAPLSQVSVLDSSGKTLRHYLASQQTDGRIFFLAPKDDTYQLQFSSAHIVPVELTLTPPVAQPQQDAASKPLSPTIATLHANPQPHLIDAFWQERQIKGTPLVEYRDNQPAIVTFLWKGQHNNVKLFGAPFGAHQDLMPLANTDLWYRSYELPNDAVMSYQLAPDVPTVPGNERASRIAILATAQQDPLNKTPWIIHSDNKYDVQSTLRLKDAVNTGLFSTSAKKLGEVSHHTLSSQILNNDRKVSLYRPAAPVPKGPMPLLILFDGSAYQQKALTPQVLDVLIEQGKIPPIHAVFVDNASAKARSEELPANPDFARFLSQELMPWLETQGISSLPELTIVAGSSFGGLASAYTALSYPKQFGNVLSLSGSFWWSPKGAEDQWLTREFAHKPAGDVVFYLAAGRFETGYFNIDILESNRHLRDVLTAKGYPLYYHEFSAGHDYFAWREQLAHGLQTLLGSKTTSKLR